MFYLFIIAVLAIFLYGVQKGFKKDSKPDEYPVTIIKDGKSVTVNGYDTALLKSEVAKATAKPKGDTPTNDVPKARFKDIPLPEWDGEQSVYKVPAGSRHYTVNLEEYTCSCPEKRWRQSECEPRTLGRVCRHMAQAILYNRKTLIAWDESLVNYIDRVDSGFNFLTDSIRQPTHADNWVEQIEWGARFEPPVNYRIGYADSAGEYSERLVSVLHLSGKHANGHEYMAAFEAGVLKTFRKDRVIRLERMAG